MLGGIDPILVFTFSEVDANATARTAISGIPLVGNSILSGIGVPIPIYLSEALTGIFVDTESIDLDVDTNVQLNTENKTPVVDQKGLHTVLSINLVSTKASLALAALIALNDLVFTRLVSKTYKISYINGSTIVLNGLFKGFSVRQQADSELVDVTLQLEKSNIVPIRPGTNVNFPQISKVTLPAGQLPSIPGAT